MEQLTDKWTVGKLLDWTVAKFNERDFESPTLLAEILLSETLGGNRIDVYTQTKRIATEKERQQLREYINRALKNEPVQFIVGKTIFFGREFNVNQSTLIPRSCTETIVTQVIEYCNKATKNEAKIADIGTGSGCIGITLAAQIPKAQIIATDISQDAIELALKNAEKLGVRNQMTFIQGDGLAALKNKFDVICSNPPYIQTTEMKNLPPNIKNWEPTSALHGGKDGLLLIRPIIQNAHLNLLEDGCLIVEIAPNIKDSVLQIATSCQTLKDAKILKDQYGDERFLRAYKS